MAFNGLTDAQAERLYILSEELGEAQQAIGKILRHGYESGWNGSYNRDDLEKELGHVYYAISMLRYSEDIDNWKIIENAAYKAQSIKPFLHHQDESLVKGLSSCSM